MPLRFSLLLELSSFPDGLSSTYLLSQTPEPLRADVFPELGLMISDGLVTADRDGDRVRYSITNKGRDLISMGAAS